MAAPEATERLLEVVTGLMTELHPEAAAHYEVTLDSGLDRDLGLDSLARMELLSRLEREFGGRFPERVLMTAETPRDLLRYLQSLKGRKTVTARPVQPKAVKRTDRRQVEFGSAESLLTVLAEHVELQPDATHITLLEGDEQVAISYAMLQQESLRVAARLWELELEPGETVALMLPTGPDYFYCFLGVLYCGGIPVPLYPPARPTQIEEHVRRHRKIISNCRAKFLITVEQVKAVGRLLQSQVPELKKIITVAELQGKGSGLIPLQHHREDVAFLQYTSGSTGDPKGVVLTHANLLANIRAMGQVCRVTAEDVFVSWLPLYHDMGLIGAWFGSLCHGCHLVAMPPLSFLARPERWLHAITAFKGTLSASPNFGYEICATRLADENLEGVNLASWRLAFNGAEPVLPDTMRRFARRFAPYGFHEEALAPVYGLAESSVGLAFPEPGSGTRIDRVQRDLFAGTGRAVPAAEADSQALEFVCCGRPLPGHQVRVVDTADREVPEREEGRLQFMGPSSTGGYYRNIDETRKLYSGKWLETGDLAYIVGGEIYLTSRQKDIIIRGGRNIYPHEIEELVGDIPGIRKGCTAVFASKKETGSAEELVVLTESRKTDKEELGRLRREIITATVDLTGVAPDDVVIARPGTVLKTSSGKIRRSACRQLYESGHVGRKKAAIWLQLTRMGLLSLAPMAQRLVRRFASVLYAGYCWVILGLFGGLVWCGLMVLPAGARCWSLAGGAVRLMCRLTGINVTVVNSESYPLGESCLLVSNHMSYLDSIILTGVLPERINFVAKAELAGNPFLRAAFKKLGVYLVDRFDAEQGVADTRKIEEGFREGAKPLFFAEGTLQRMPGLLPFQMGAFVLASNENVPIVPVIIKGTRNILRGGSWFPRHGRVQVTIGSLCRPMAEGWEGAVELRERVRGVMLEQLGEPDLSGEYTSLMQLGLSRPQKKRE